MALSLKERHDKLAKLIEIEGFDDKEAFLRACIFDSVNPGICINPGCDYSTEVEPDQRQGHCELCGTQTVQAALVLARLI